MEQLKAPLRFISSVGGRHWLSLAWHGRPPRMPGPLGCYGYARKPGEREPHATRYETRYKTIFDPQAPWELERAQREYVARVQAQIEEYDAHLQECEAMRVREVAAIPEVQALLALSDDEWDAEVLTLRQADHRGRRAAEAAEQPLGVIPVGSPPAR